MTDPTPNTNDDSETDGSAETATDSDTDALTETPTEAGSEVDTAPGMAHTLDAYAGFLEEFVEAGHTFQGFEPLADQAVIVRHDVDLSPDRALAMARREADLGVTTTYCFMLSTPAYNLLQHVEELEEILSLGHDVALHFDTHHHWNERPGTETLESTVESERRTLERLVDTPVETVSFHMPPEWVLNATFDGFVNAYGPQFFGDIDYISDSQEKWRRQAPFEGDPPDRVQILIHPGLWTPEDDRMDDLLDRAAARRRARIDRYVEDF